MKLRYAQIVFNAFVGLLVLWILRTNMDRDIDSARAAIQRGWLVVGILFAGAYVILRCRKEDREYYQPSSSQEAAGSVGSSYPPGTRTERLEEGDSATAERDGSRKKDERG